MLFTQIDKAAPLSISMTETFLIKKAQFPAVIGVIVFKSKMISIYTTFYIAQMAGLQYWGYIQILYFHHQSHSMHTSGFMIWTW